MRVEFSPHCESLGGKCAIVTGAARGIGRAVAEGLARNGASVILAARSADRLGEVREGIAGGGGKALAAPGDLRSEEYIRSLPALAAEKFGRLDILVNNAGIGIYGPMEEASAEDWDQVMAVNARAAFLLSRQVLPHLRARGLSWIVNISSVVGVKGYENQAIYTASKHAMMGWSKSLAREVGRDGIRVHALCPGGVDTEMVARARPDLDRSVLMKPEEIADAVLFLVTRKGNAVIDQLDLRRASSTPWG